MMQNEQNDDVREAWVLRAGAELWKALVAESGNPREDTQKALEAVRYALDCARRLRCAGEVPDHERALLSAEAVRSAEMQARALHQWGRGRGLNWEADWGTQWGEALSPKSAAAPDSADADLEHPARLLKRFL